MSRSATNPKDRGAAPWILLAPFLALFALFTAYPLLSSVSLSLSQSFGPAHTRFVGLDNFAHMARDPLFWTSLSNTTLYTLGSIALQLPIALALALLLERPGLRGRHTWRLVLFSPSLVGIPFAAIIFALAFEKNTGLVNQLLHHATPAVGLAPFDLEFDWLTTRALWTFILASLWMYVGLNMVYFQAALQNVPRELLEAARVDGAGPLQRFLHVTLPAIRPVAGYVVLLSVIGSFQVFELPYLILTVAGKASDRASTLVMYLYTHGFDTGDLGFASAVGWALSLVLIAAAALQRVVARRDSEASA
ncbi:MAG: sugar ABC transporter permease [Phycisphaeraceae bacterium]|nr:MAG: sugar ABC transporter permease [Phycisphaeraceae bacterium]